MSLWTIRMIHTRVLLVTSAWFKAWCKKNVNNKKNTLRKFSHTTLISPWIEVRLMRPPHSGMWFSRGVTTFKERPAIDEARGKIAREHLVLTLIGCAIKIIHASTTSSHSAGLFWAVHNLVMPFFLYLVTD